jgi:hypothetical protein
MARSTNAAYRGKLLFAIWRGRDNSSGSMDCEGWDKIKQAEIL